MSDFENQFQTLFQYMELGAYLQRADGSVIDVNPAALKMLDMTREEFVRTCSASTGWRMVGENGAELLPDLHPAAVALRSAEQVRDVVAAIHKEERAAPVWVKMDAIPLQPSPGTTPATVLVTMKDISEVKRLEKFKARETEKERENLQLQMLHAQMLESLGVLAGGIAHDFNNILTSIMGNTELALMQLTPGTPACDNLRRVEKASRRAAGLIKQMLSYLGGGMLSAEPIDLNKLVEEMQHMLQVVISKKAKLRLDLTRPLRPIQADAVQMRQIVMNLVLNASESLGKEVGKIKISSAQAYYDEEELKEFRGSEAMAPGFYLSLAVSDTGCGLDQEARDRIFDPFFPAHFTGRGLGMAAVLGIVRGLKGGVKLQSDVGKGSTFTVLLPAREEIAAVARPAEPAREPLGKGLVLLVDDEEEVCELVGTMLAKLGYQVVTARDGRAALELYLQRDDFAFVLLDLTMPVMDGEQTFEQLKGIDPTVKVVITSGYSEKEVARRFEGKGVKGVLHKPFDMAALRKVIG